MRLLMVSDGVLPDRMGGSYRYLAELCVALTERGHECHVLVPRARPELPLDETIEGVHYHRVAACSGNPLLRFAWWPRALARRLHELGASVQPDVICVHWGFMASLIATSRRWRDVPKVSFFYGPWGDEFAVRYGRQRPLVRAAASAMAFCEGRVVRACRQVIVLSEYSARQVQAIHGIDPSRLRIIPPAVDMTRFKPAEDREATRRALAIPDAGTVAITVRRLDRRTGVELLLRAVGRAGLSANEFHLIVVGTGPDEDRLHRLVDSLRVSDRVTFLGFVEDDHLASYYQASDLCVMPSIALEGFGLATLESLACGTPVLGTRIGATPEILSSLDADLLVDPLPSAMGQALRSFTRSRGRFADRSTCLGYAKKLYSWGRTAARVEETLGEAAGIQSKT